MRSLVSMALAIAMISGCALKNHSVPIAAPEFAKADYTVLGKTNQEECGTYVFVDWAHLFKNEKATTTGVTVIPFIGGGPKEESRALYHALDKMPEATHLLAHRSHTTTSGLVIAGYPLFGKRCSSVDAHGVKIGDRPAAGTPTL